MGKKATSYLIYLVTIYSTIIVALLTVFAWFALNSAPERHWLFPLLGLMMVPLLVVNFLFLIFWIIKLKLWALAPLAAILLNFGFISATLQIRLKPASVEAHDFKIATYNVHSFLHGNFRMTVEIIARYMKEQGVDVVCFQEFEENAKFSVDSIRRAFAFLPYSCTPDNGGSNLAIFSRYPIEKSQMISFKETDNSVLWIDLMVRGHKLKVIDAHFQTTNINQSQEEIAVLRRATLPKEEDKIALRTLTKRLHKNFIKRAQQAREVKSIIQNTDRSVILCGDFNDTPASYVYKQMTTMLEDSFKSCGRGYTYTYKGIGKLLRIDYILYSRDLRAIRYDDTPQDWSDHNPVLLELLLGDGEAES